VNGPNEPTGPAEWPEGGPSPEAEPREPFLPRLLRSTIAPDVLRDAGHDAPLSRRGRILFWGTVSVLVVAIAVLFLVTVSK
jgi:hypothetical protein